MIFAVGGKAWPFAEFCGEEDSTGRSLTSLFIFIHLDDFLFLVRRSGAKNGCVQPRGRSARFVARD